MNSIYVLKSFIGRTTCFLKSIEISVLFQHCPLLDKTDGLAKII